jgi:hypothetical protein
VAKAGGKLEKDREEDDRSEGKSDSDGWRGIGNPPSRLSTLSFAAGFASAGRQLDGDVGWRRGFMLPFPGGHSRRLGTRWDPAGAAGRPMHGPYAYAWATAPASLFLGLATPAVFFSLDSAACGLRKWPSGQVGSQGSIRRIWPSLRPPGRTSAEGRNARTAFRGADLLLQTSTVAVDLTDP